MGAARAGPVVCPWALFHLRGTVDSGEEWHAQPVQRRQPQKDSRINYGEDVRVLEAGAVFPAYRRHKPMALAGPANNVACGVPTGGGDYGAAAA